MNKIDPKKMIQELIMKYETIDESIKNLQEYRNAEIIKDDYNLDLCVECDKQISILKRKLFLHEQTKYNFDRYEDSNQYIYDCKVEGTIKQRKNQVAGLFKCLVIDYKEQHISTKKFVDTISNMLLDVDYINPIIYNQINEMEFHN